MSQLEVNKQVVLAFWDKVVNQRDFDGAARYLGPTYLEHRADAPDGPVGLHVLINELRVRSPNGHSEVKRVFADGDFVILQVHVVHEPGTRGTAQVEIFRVENGRPVEHWDVEQPIAPSFANANGPF
jgi:predicted SnoaL-like aldol condensation-catalyzing enzyme